MLMTEMLLVYQDFWHALCFFKLVFSLDLKFMIE